jgi:hypothetical protein
MKASLVTFRVLAFILMAVLAGMMMLSWSARMPCLEISSLPGLDDGQTVLVQGLLVDLRVNDGGSESLVLADREGAASVWVFVSQAIRPQPSSYAHVGDELRVVGSLALSRSGMSLYSDSDSVVLLARAEQVLTVGGLSSHWELFLGDDISVSGVLMQTVASSGPRLFDIDMERSLSLSLDGGWDDQLLGRTVTVIGRLVLDEESMSLVLQATAIHA